MSTQSLHIQRKSMTRQQTAQTIVPVVVTAKHQARRLEAGLDMYGLERPARSKNEGLWALSPQISCLAQSAIVALVPTFKASAILLPADLDSQGVAT